MAKKKRAHTDTTVPYIPADPMDIMGALLRTPPPHDELWKEKARKAAAKRKRAKRKQR